MSFTKNAYDEGAYNTDIEQSMKIGQYMLGQPYVSCEPCYPTSPFVRIQSQGGSIVRDTPLIDIDSELMNLNRKYSRDPSQKYHPQCNGIACEQSGMPCSQGVVGRCAGRKPGERATDDNLHHFQDCNQTTEPTRLLNPPCTLRGTGINRWEWLCKDPQDNVIIPFSWNVSNRLMMKDNHRPCVPRPVDQRLSHPSGKVGLPTERVENYEHVTAVPTYPASIGWQSSENIRRY
jgi:hypothetical protein